MKHIVLQFIDGELSWHSTHATERQAIDTADEVAEDLNTEDAVMVVPCSRFIQIEDPEEEEEEEEEEESDEDD